MTSLRPDNQLVRKLKRGIELAKFFVGRYLVVIKDDTRLFALVGGRSGAGTASGASSTARQGATAATCRTAAYRDASTACWQAATTAEPEDDHSAGLIGSLHWSDVDVVQCGHYRQQRCPRRLVRSEGLAGRCWRHESSRGLVRG
jgi:hypothetical protein